MKYRFSLIFALIAAFLLGSPHFAEARPTKVRPHTTKGKPRGPAPSPTLQQEQMLNELGFIQNIFRAAYGPMEWKKEALGWNFESAIAKAKRTVKRQPQMSLKEFQKIIKEVFNGFGDYHVKVTFYSTEHADLPFDLQGIGSRYFVTWVDPKVPSSLSIGDELLEFQGMPIAQVVDDFKQSEMRCSHPLTDQAFAEIDFTDRYGDKGHEVPQGEVEVVYRKVSTGEIASTTLAWDYSPDDVGLYGLGRKEGVTALAHRQPKRTTDWDDSANGYLSPHYGLFVDEEPEGPSPKSSSKKGSLPRLGPVLWENDPSEAFDAYLFELPSGRRAGYVRIPTFMTSFDKAVPEFARIIGKFEEETDVLVINLRTNFGGNIFYMYSLLSMLTDKPLQLPMERMRINQEDVYEASIWINKLGGITTDEEARQVLGMTNSGYPVDLSLAKALLEYDSFIIDQWKAGHLFTDLGYMYLREITPHPRVHYTKPILVLINSLDMSCGDLFPAILQDNKRALLMGTRTAGAGGGVQHIQFPNLSGIADIALTRSVGMRLDGTPIENRGVVPDIAYEATVEDLQGGYAVFAARIREVLEEI